MAEIGFVPMAAGGENTHLLTIAVNKYDTKTVSADQPIKRMLGICGGSVSLSEPGGIQYFLAGTFTVTLSGDGKTISVRNQFDSSASESVQLLCFC